MHNIPDWWLHFWNHVPFISLAIKSEQTPMFTRLIETVIMAIATAFVGFLFAIPIIQKDIEVVRIDISRIDTKIEKVDEKVENMKRDIYRPYTGGGGS